MVTGLYSQDSPMRDVLFCLPADLKKNRGADWLSHMPHHEKAYVSL